MSLRQSAMRCLALAFLALPAAIPVGAQTPEPYPSRTVPAGQAELCLVRRRDALPHGGRAPENDDRHRPDPRAPPGQRGSAHNVIGGHVQMMIDAVTTMAPNVEAGQVRALATTGPARSAILPNVPSASEAGVPGYEATIWLGFMAPRGTPPAIVDKLNGAIRAIIGSPDIKATWARQGAVPMAMSPAEFDAYLRSDIAKWAKVVVAAGLKPE